MDIDTKLRVVKIMEEYSRKPLLYGTYDCNLMVLKMFEPEKHERFVGRYKTVIGGARVAMKEFGYTHINDYMEESDDYVSISKPFMMHGDIIFSDTERVAMVATGYNRAFAINPQTNTFMDCNVSIPESYKIYRRI